MNEMIDNELRHRIRQIRKYYNLNQNNFAKKLGVTNTAVSKMEVGTYNVTNTMQNLICKEFNINPIWLSTGEGEMLANDEDMYMNLIDTIMSDTNDFPKTLFKAFSRFSTEDWKALEHMIDIFLEEERNSHE